MIIDMRTYTLSPGLLPDFLEKFEAEGLPLLKEYLGPPLGFFYTEIGPLNQVVHMWGYDSLADRELKRAALEADPRWWEYRNRMTPFGHLTNQENKILKPARFSPPLLLQGSKKSREEVKI